MPTMFQTKKQAKITRESNLEIPMHAIHFSVHGVSDAGCQRKNNEDAIFFGSDLDTHNDKNSQQVLLVVADGMGGHNAGEIASNMAKEEVCTVRETQKGDPHKALIKVFTKANRNIYRAANKNKQYEGMGTTCTALIMRNDIAYCAHVGDSRAYLVRNGAIYRLTEDHTIQTEMEKEGLIERDTTNSELESSLITRALGIDKSVKVDTWAKGLPIEHDDRFLLCSDGLSNLISDDEVKNLVLTNPARFACNKLIDQAKRRGGHDNISVVVAYRGKS